MGGNPPPFFIVFAVDTGDTVVAVVAVDTVHYRRYSRCSRYSTLQAIQCTTGDTVSPAGDYALFFYYFKSLMMILSSGVSIC